MQDVLLSVIVACRNGEKTIGTQLEALAAQQWDSAWEVLVVDNRSTDGSRAVVAGYVDRLPNLRIVDATDRLGVGYARNVGVRHAGSDSIAFCDADDQVSPGWVAAMGEALADHPFVAGTLETHLLNPPWVRASRRHPRLQGPQDAHDFLPHAGVGNLGLRRYVHEAVGGFDEELACHEDTDFCWKVQLKGIPLHHAPEAVVHYRFRDSLGDIYRQARCYGQNSLVLYQRYRLDGMPHPNRLGGLRIWVKLAVRSPFLISRGGRARWVWHLGTQLGRLRGSVAVRWRPAPAQPAGPSELEKGATGP